MNSQERLWSHCKSGPQPSSCVATLNAGKSHCGSLVLLLLYFSMASKELYEVLYFEQSLSIYHPSVSACCAVHQRKLRCPGLGRGNMLEQEKKKKTLWSREQDLWPGWGPNIQLDNVNFLVKRPPLRRQLYLKHAKEILGFLSLSLGLSSLHVATSLLYVYLLAILNGSSFSVSPPFSPGKLPGFTACLPQEGFC